MGAEALVAAHLRVQPAPFVPEFRLYLAEQLVPLWQATEALAGARAAAAVLGIRLAWQPGAGALPAGYAGSRHR